ncbi:TetR/AcrR family transcriptional regulator [Naasia lichenicola]|uniref:TetR/AcrR family transcriptional regulator n=1 Tax=Naasia lichenicola TaxID=2565933 RepID=A0A4S4FMA0_9MICO|nr:TetR/AcrR family transcriptional regulator [Naasia lichenicola]THG31553.1 TetR/AcrR family transcriptional regulator [Naasia lichenicola]
MARSREFDDELLRATALGFFWSSGYEKTSLGEISKASGVGNGSIYAAYGSKHGLFMSIFESYCESRVQIVTHAMATGREPIDSVREFLAVVIADCANQPGRRGCLLVNTISEFGSSKSDVMALARRTNLAMTDVIEDRIRGAKFAAEREHTVAAQILLVSQGLISLSRLNTPSHELTGIAEAYSSTLDAA